MANDAVRLTIEGPLEDLGRIARALKAAGVPFVPAYAAGSGPRSPAEVAGALRALAHPLNPESPLHGRIRELAAELELWDLSQRG